MNSIDKLENLLEQLKLEECRLEIYTETKMDLQDSRLLLFAIADRINKLRSMRQSLVRRIRHLKNRAERILRVATTHSR